MEEEYLSFIVATSVDSSLKISHMYNKIKQWTTIFQLHFFSVIPMYTDKYCVRILPHYRVVRRDFLQVSFLRQH